MDKTNFTIIVTEPIHSAGINYLKREGVKIVEMPPNSSEADLLRISPQADALITRGNLKVTRDIMAASPKLKVIGVHGVGWDHIDIEAAKNLDKRVFNTPTALTDTVAEMTIALMLALTRRIVSADKAVRSEKWVRKYGDLVGSEIMGKTIGIIGLGRIGTAVAYRLKPFKVNLIYFDVLDRSGLEKELNIRKANLDCLLRESDIITVHVPLTPQTEDLISRREFKLMKKGAYIVNVSRGKIVNEKALIEALNEGRIAGAALDVFEKEPIESSNPLMHMDNVILTPHIGASSREAMERMAIQVSEGVMKILRGGIIENLIV
ncbi:MAG: hydroxyacid dehydrogenase [Candidatus Bathyarchaeia archaeon]